MMWLVIGKVLASVSLWTVVAFYLVLTFRSLRDRDDFSWSACLGMGAMVFAAFSAFLMHLLWGG